MSRETSPAVHSTPRNPSPDSRTDSGLDSRGDSRADSGLDSGGAEFDRYAEGYTGGSDNRLKRLLGRGLSQFIEVKAEWLLADLAARGWEVSNPERAPRLLDYGCGTGVLLQALRRLGFQGLLAGADISSEMLEVAEDSWTRDSGLDGDRPVLDLIRGGRAPQPDASFDVVVASGVFHHVQRPQRAAVHRDIARLLDRPGRAYVFEHNPFNPVTRFVVRRTPIDRNAVLLRASEVRGALRTAGLAHLQTFYIMFFPPRLRWIRGLEPFLGWLPLGGQYVVSGTVTDGVSNSI